MGISTTILSYSVLFCLCSTLLPTYRGTIGFSAAMSKGAELLPSWFIICNPLGLLPEPSLSGML